MLLILPWCHLYWWLHFALGTSLVPPLWVPPLCSWYFLGASFMLWVPPLCSWYFPDASIMLLVPLLVHGPSLMFLTPSQCSWYSCMFLDLPLRFGSPFSFRTPPHPPVLPSCSWYSRMFFDLPLRFWSTFSFGRKKERKKKTPPPLHTQSLHQFIHH